MEKIYGHFKDSATYDSENKTALSVRDGFLEYAGSEIGQEPADKVFKVYRSPATIANVANLMQGIPLTNNHVDLDGPVTDSKGSVKNAVMVDLKDESTNSNLAIKNTIDISSEMNEVLKSGKRELSLGYIGTLVEYDGEEYDFEQRDIEPHHLAIVDQGRCGSVCSFIDKKIKVNNMDDKFKDLFYDAQGMPNIKEIISMVEGLRDAIGNMPLDDVKKLVPILQKVNEKTGASQSAAEGIESESSEAPAEGEEIEDAEKEVETEDSKEELEDKKSYKDSAEFKDAIAKAVDEKVKEYATVVEKARDFIDSSYKFNDKDAKQIMRDALATEHGTQSFSDEELNVAFKLLKPSQGKYANFADASNNNTFSALANKEY